MRIQAFQQRFREEFSEREVTRPTRRWRLGPVRRMADPLSRIDGMISIKKQRLLRTAFSCLPPDESYLEVGTFQGKSLLSAMAGNPSRPVYACDNFSEFQDQNSLPTLEKNLREHGVNDRVIFFDSDFRRIMSREHIREPIGLYFYDGAHDRESQRDAITLAEPLLADEALLLVDDWRFAEDSASYAEAGTREALQRSMNDWQLLYQLRARWNGDHTMWWNGVGVLAFRRKA